MTASLTGLKAPCRRSSGARQVNGFAMVHGALASLLLAGLTPAAMADPVPNRVFADCELSFNTQAGRINTVAGLVQDILRTNQPPPNDPEIESPTIAYVVVYTINNDNNGQKIVDGRGGPLLGFTGPVICVNRNYPNLAGIEPALQTEDILDIDILDLQDALILRHAPAGAGAPGANRICHTTDGNTDCFDID